MKPHKLKQTLTDINVRVKLPFLVIHYSRQRKHAMVDGVDGSDYVGYYLSTPEHRERWAGGSIEWILLATLRGYNG